MSLKHIQSTLDQKTFEALKVTAIRLDKSAAEIIRTAITQFLNSPSIQEVLQHGKNEQTQQEN
jgi:hypothetical protein